MKPCTMRERAERFLKTVVGLTGFERHYPRELSGGMQQRVNLARALAVTSVLLMDEPLAASGRADARVHASRVAEDLEPRVNRLFITHQINEAVYLADRVVVMLAHDASRMCSASRSIGRGRGG